jgi:hypothetical protein
MSTASSSTMPLAPSQPALSEPERLMNVFFAPTKTFADIRRNASWWVPFVLSSLFAYALVFTVDKKVGFEQVSENQIKMNHRAMEQLDQLPPAERARRMDISVKVTKIISYVFPLFILITDVIIAAILMATFNFGLGTEVKFGQALAIVMYAGIVTLLRPVLAIATLLAGSNIEAFNFSNPVGTNPAYYMSLDSATGWLYHLAGWFDVFTIWLFIVMGVGFAVVGKKKISSGIAVMLGWFVVLALVSTAWSAL